MAKKRKGTGSREKSKKGRRTRPEREDDLDVFSQPSRLGLRECPHCGEYLKAEMIIRHCNEPAYLMSRRRAARERADIDPLNLLTTEHEHEVSSSADCLQLIAATDAARFRHSSRRQLCG